jgi:DNA polymerase III epsilon subunit-like protein
LFGSRSKTTYGAVYMHRPSGSFTLEFSTDKLPTVGAQLGISLKHHDAASDALACALIALRAMKQGFPIHSAAAVRPPAIIGISLVPTDWVRCETATPPAAASGVRRGKAALSSGCKSHPATAPAGSNRSSHAGDEVAEASG